MEKDETAQIDTQTVDRDLAESLSRSFCTALILLADATRAEALVMQAIQSLDPGVVTSDAVRAAVVVRLVRAQMSTIQGSASSACQVLGEVLEDDRIAE